MMKKKQAVRMDLLRWDDGLGQGERVRILPTKIMMILKSVKTKPRSENVYSRL